MHGFDIGVGLVILLGGIRSYFRGLTREVMSTIGLIAVLIVTVWGYRYIPPYFEPVIASPWWRQIAVYTALILVALGAYILWANLVERMLLFSQLSIPDRFLGGLFGMVKVGVLIAVLFIWLIQAAPDRVAILIGGARLAPPLLQTAQAITTLLPGEVKHEFRHAYSRVLQPSGKQIAQPSHPEPATSHSPSQDAKPSADMLENDDRALRQLIKRHSKEP